MKTWHKVLLGAAGVAVAMQVVRPSMTNPPVTGDVGAPPPVDAVLRRACYDCHSNETRWPWYSQVAPVSWLVAHDVDEGRRELNFSEWQGQDAKRQAKKLHEIGEEVREGEMPMAIYLPMHPEAKLSDADRQVLLGWAAGGGAPAAKAEAGEAGEVAPPADGGQAGGEAGEGEHDEEHEGGEHHDD